METPIYYTLKYKTDKIKNKMVFTNYLEVVKFISYLDPIQLETLIVESFVLQKWDGATMNPFTQEPYTK